MTTFFPVTHSILSIHALLADVLPNYDIPSPTACMLLQAGLNDTFLVQTHGPSYILRAYRTAWRSLAAIHYEVDVLLHLARAGIPISVPIARKDGTIVGRVMAPEGVRYLVLFTYAPGKEIAYAAEEATDAYLYGKGAAKLHAATDTFHTSHQRFTLDLEHLLAQPLQSIRPLLAHRRTDWEYLVTLAEKLRLHVHALPLESLEAGFCHGDLHGGNAHRDQAQTLTFFDFDACGMGWRAYDIAVFRWSARLRGKEQERWEAFLRGYTEERPLHTLDIQAVPYFVAIRHFWLLGIHTSNGQDWGFAWMNDHYFDQAVTFLRAWEAEFLTEPPNASQMHA